MNDNYTDITVVLDRSGSMRKIQLDMEGGLNQFFDDQKKIPGRCTCSLYQFDTQYEPVFEGFPVSDVPHISLIPRGNTALLDAVGRTIVAVGARLSALPENERPQKVVMVIVTDGEENSSKEFTQETVNEMVKLQRETYKWEFVYLGANQDAITVAKSIGIPAANSMTYQASSAGSKRSLAAMSMNVGSLRAGTVGSASFSVEQRKEQDELLKRKQ